jgi:glutamate-5-semialdehyde dehydrogenase
MSEDAAQGAADLEAMGAAARAASRRLATTPTAAKDEALRAIARELLAREDRILAANAADVDEARRSDLSPSLVDRLLLTPARLEALASDVERVATLPDPVGERFDEGVLPNGLPVHKRRVPLGVVAAIYEARPNVTVDVAALCLKTGNATILRGGKETLRSNAALGEAISGALEGSRLPAQAVQVLSDPGRELVRRLLRLDRFVDVVIPRGGEALHRFCREHATIPVISGGIGVCHLFVEATADLDRAREVIHNAKVQRPSVCNALDTLLVERRVAERLLPSVGADLAASGVELRADEEGLAILLAAGLPAIAASEGDFGTEFLALVLSLRVVDGLDEAIEHIHRHGSGHSEAILTEDAVASARFVDEVDAATVLVNASTRFNDGGQLGLGAEVAISTQKLHARGPMALRELTTYKWVVGAPPGPGSTRYFVRE